MSDIILTFMLEQGMGFDDACMYFVMLCIFMIAGLSAFIDLSIDIGTIFYRLLKKFILKLKNRNKPA